MPTLFKRRWRFHGLKKPKVRQDWNKYNLYNLSRITIPNTASRTYFQQKWTAKASARAYHGEVVREQQWERMFSRQAPAVVPMDPAYLAGFDGSEHAAGRGSGLELAPDPKGRVKRPPEATPYMQMAFHPIERRLDTAIFRALFASSTRQARQFVVHGHVKVNGKKMIHPGYLLNPGDMFQVDPESVMFGTGAWKGTTPDLSYFDAFPPDEAAALRQATPGCQPRVLPQQDEPDDEENITTNTMSLSEALAELGLDDPDSTDPEADENTEAASPPSSTDPLALTKKQLASLRTRALDIITEPPPGTTVTASRKTELRAFAKELKSHISRPSNVTPSMLDDLEMQLQGILERVNLSSTASRRARSDPSTSPTSPPSPPTPSTPIPFPYPTPSALTSTPRHLPPDKHILAPPTPANPHDASKPYATPWRPRDFMPAFAFIPRYLEVNQNICAAVFLRLPVARPGLAEVPTPFHPETMQLAFNWYLRRR